MLHIPLTNVLLPAAINRSQTKKHISYQKILKNFLGKVQENGPAGRRKDKTERITGLPRKTREEIVKWNQMTALRFQTGARHQTSSVSLRGPLQRSGGCSTIIEDREVSWSRQHPSRIGPSRWRGCNHRSHDNLQQDLADRRMLNPVDPVLNRHTSQERQPGE